MYNISCYVHTQIIVTIFQICYATSHYVSNHYYCTSADG